MNGNELPQLIDGACCILTIPFSCFVQKEDVKEQYKEKVSVFIPKNTTLMIGVRNENIDNNLCQYRVKMHQTIKNVKAFGVEVVLQEDLKIETKNGNSGKLLPCRCYIPALKKT